ncbi:MAG: dihydroxy-acid dehydratase [Azoarcus sp.]|nr:dihydroxy-acid dehydratase [Azoarcus sp.]
MGIPEEDFDKPKIAIVNSSSKLSVCYAHLDEVARQVERAIRAAGGVPFEIRTVAPSDFVTSAGKQGRYLMPTRDLLVNDVEVQVEGAELDGMILLASCDKTTPGQLMACARLDIPALILPCGYQLGGECGGRHVDIEEVYKAVGTVKAGRMKLIELEDMTRHAIKGPGVCAGLATANTMQCMAEALGMALPHSAPIRAGGPRLAEQANKAGAKIVELVHKNIRPRDILTPAAFRNAVTVAVAMGGSVNCVRHLIATSVEAECPVDVLAEFERAGDVDQITLVRPNGPHRIEDLDAAGGCAGVMRQLRERLDLSVLTVTGATLEANLAEVPPPDEAFIRPVSNPFRREPGLIVIRGNLAPEGAVVKLSAVPESVRRFIGVARVFEDENEAITGLQDGTVRAGDVIVLRMMGAKGGPGTVFAASFMAALVGAGLGDTVAVVTDGELSGLNSGITIGQVMPEAAEGGPLAVVRNGDTVEIDLTRRVLAFDVTDDELAARLAAFVPPVLDLKPGWLSMYRQLVQPMSQGAVLGERCRPGVQK